MFILKHAFYNLMSGAHRKSGLRQLQTLERKLLSKDVRFAVPFAYRGKGFFKTIEPRQNPEEIETLYKAVLELSPRRILEIGTARGGSLSARWGIWWGISSLPGTFLPVICPFWTNAQALAKGFSSGRNAIRSWQDFL
jgi:hypothetical protein